MLFATLAFLFAVLWTANTLADQVTCTWSLGSSPKSSGFSQFCTASLGDLNKTAKAYACSDQFGRPNVVANWGVQGANILKFGDPCAENGWATENEYCKVTAAALCVGNDCRGETAGDECSWPSPVEASKLPKSVTVWTKQ